MFKNPFIRFLIAINFIVFVCLAFINIRGIIRNREQQTLKNASAEEFLEISDKKKDREGEMAYADSKRLEAISRFITKNKTISDADLSWIMSLMEKTFPNGRPYEVDQAFFADMTVLPVKTFTPKQKEAVFQKCSHLLSEQASGVRPQSPYITETCCRLFGQTQDQRAVSLLMPLLQNLNGRVQVIAARTLTKLGHPTKVNIPNGGFGTAKK